MLATMVDMRKILALFLATSLLLPTTAFAKEDEKKAPSRNSQSNNSAKAQENKNPTPQPSSQSNSQSSNNNSANNSTTSGPKNDAPSTSSNSNSATTNPGNSNPGNAGNNSSNNEAGSNSNSASGATAPGNSGSNQQNSAKPDAPGKPESTGKPEATGRPETTGKPEVTGKKELTLDEGEVKNFVVRFRDDASIATEATNLRGQSARVARTFNNVFKGLSATLNAKQLEALKKNPRVELIEEDIEVRTTQSGTQSNAPWGLDRIDQRALPLSGTFAYSSAGTSVRAYVIDTGLRASHQEFTGRVSSGFSSIADGRGTDDCNGHGTHVAGSIAGTTYGVSKSATIVPVRVLGCDGSGTLSGVIAGLDWIASNHTAGTPAVANMSLGAGASSTLDSAVVNLINRGITVVVAAGNSAASACNYSPARVASAITVAASTINDQLASFSNHGSCVDLVAPGTSITSSWISSDASSAILDGTSMASPHVAGAVASLLSGGYLSPSNVDARLKSLATTGVFASLPSGTPNSLLYSVIDSSSGSDGSGGVVTDPEPVLTVPDAPGTPIAAPIKRAAQLAWQLTSDDGGTPVTSQVIDVITGNRVVKSVAVTGTATAATIRSLNPRLSYTFTIRAINSVGTSAASAPSNAVTPLR